MKEIIFTLTIPELSEAAEFPSPSIKNLPEWYRKMSPYTDSKLHREHGEVNTTVKKCVPVFDATSAGYIIKLWSEVYVKKTMNGIEISSSIKRGDVPQAVQGHPIVQAETYPTPLGCEKSVLKWINPWHIKTPKGYSSLIINPSHRDLPFKLMEGLVDTDTFPLSINFPFFLKEGFEGTIPYGTPIGQVIPIKRDEFSAKRGNFDAKKYESLHNLHDSTFINRYKTKWWHRKKYGALNEIF